SMTGVISGTPTVDGEFIVTIGASNDGGADEEFLSLTIAAAAEESDETPYSTTLDVIRSAFAATDEFQNWVEADDEDDAADRIVMVRKDASDVSYPLMAINRIGQDYYRSGWRTGTCELLFEAEPSLQYRQ